MTKVIEYKAIEIVVEGENVEYPIGQIVLDREGKVRDAELYQTTFRDTSDLKALEYFVKVMKKFEWKTPDDLVKEMGKHDENISV